MGLIIDDDDVGAEVVEEIVVVDAIDVTAILLSVEGFVMLVVDGVAFVAKNDQYICDEDDVDDKYDYDSKYDDDDDDDDQYDHDNDTDVDDEDKYDDEHHDKYDSSEDNNNDIIDSTDSYIDTKR